MDYAYDLEDDNWVSDDESADELEYEAEEARMEEDRPREKPPIIASKTFEPSVSVSVSRDQSTSNGTSVKSETVKLEDIPVP